MFFLFWNTCRTTVSILETTSGEIPSRFPGFSIGRTTEKRGEIQEKKILRGVKSWAIYGRTDLGTRGRNPWENSERISEGTFAGFFDGTSLRVLRGTSDKILGNNSSGKPIKNFWKNPV